MKAESIRAAIEQYKAAAEAAMDEARKAGRWDKGSPTAQAEVEAARKLRKALS